MSGRCPVCRGSEIQPFARAWDCEYHTTDEVYEYERCSECRAIFLPDPPVDQLRVIYPSNYYSAKPSEAAGVLQRIKKHLDGRLFRELLRSLKGDELKVLDVGGGSGWLATTIRDQDSRVRATHVVDIDEGMRETAIANGHEFHCSRIEDFEADESFDLMILLNLIEHVSDPGAVLRALRRAVNDGGLLLLKTPNTDTPDCRALRNVNWGGFHCPRHWVLFDEKNLGRLAREAGWEVVWTRYTQGAPQLTATLLGWLSDKRIIRITAERPMHRHWLYTPTLAAMAAFDFLRLPFVRTAQMFMLLRPAAS